MTKGNMFGKSGGGSKLLGDLSQKKNVKTEIVIENEIKNEIKVVKPLNEAKRKDNRGRKKKYAPGEVVKFTFPIEYHLSQTVKALAKGKRMTIAEVISPYMKEWMDGDREVKGSDAVVIERRPAGFNLSPEIRNLTFF